MTAVPRKHYAGNTYEDATGQTVQVCMGDGCYPNGTWQDCPHNPARKPDLAALARAHVEHKAWPLVRNDSRRSEDGYIHRCRKDGNPWPCETFLLLSALTHAEQRTRDLRLDIARRIKGISLPPGPDFAWLDGHRPFIEAAMVQINEAFDAREARAAIESPE